MSKATKDHSADQTTKRLRYIAEGIETVRRGARRLATAFPAVAGGNGDRRPLVRLEGDLNLLEDEIQALQAHIVDIKSALA